MKIKIVGTWHYDEVARTWPAVITSNSDNCSSSFERTCKNHKKRQQKDKIANVRNVQLAPKTEDSQLILPN